MTDTTLERLRQVYIFSELDDQEIMQVARLCKLQRVPADHIVFQEGDTGNQMYIIQAGRVRVSLITRRPDGAVNESTINVLYPGQSFGEMILLYGASRSATATTVEETNLLVLAERDFYALCEQSPRIGYRVMRQLASDLAYKLRSSNLLLRGNIRWQHNELGQRIR